MLWIICGLLRCRVPEKTRRKTEKAELISQVLTCASCALLSLSSAFRWEKMQSELAAGWKGREKESKSALDLNNVDSLGMHRPDAATTATIRTKRN